MPEPAVRIVHLLAFDFGLKAIGVAVGQSVTGTATPLRTLAARNGVPDWSRIAALIREWSVNQLVVGLPLNMDDTESDMSVAARRFGAELKARFGLPLAMVDERLSSREALHHAHGDRAASHGIAATLIAQTYLR